MIAVAVAVVVTGVVMLLGKPTDKSRAFLSGPEAIFWLYLLCAQAALWVGVAPFVVAGLRGRIRDLESRKELVPRQLALVLAAALVLLLVAVLFNYGGRLGLYESLASSHIPTGKKWPLPYHTVKMPIFSALGFLVGLAAIGGMWLAAAGLAAVGRGGTTAAGVDRFLELRRELTTMLAVAGTVIGLATLSTGALRSAVLAANGEPAYRDAAVACVAGKIESPTLPAADAKAKAQTSLDELISGYPDCRRLLLSFDGLYVVAYGIFFTALLAIAFVPGALALRGAGARLRDAAFPLPQPEHPDFFATVDKRAGFDRFLQTDLSASATFKAGVAIATPLVASLLSTVLPS